MKVIKELMSYIVIIIAVIVVRTYVVTPVKVDGQSMEPILENNEILILKKYDKKIKRFDIIVFKYSSDKLIKRVIGLPGETVEYKSNKLYINNIEMIDVKLEKETNDFKTTVIPEGSYFVLGDNRTDSLDSRIIGFISKDNILGKTSYRIFPFDEFGKF